MNEYIHPNVIRAVSSEYVARKVKPLLFVVTAVIVILFGLFVWLTTVSAWWWIALIFWVGFSILLAGIMTTALVALKVLKPAMSNEQQIAVVNFVDKLERLSDVSEMHPLILFFKLVKSLVFPRPESFIKLLATDTMSLTTDLKMLVQTFKQQA